MKSPKRAGCRGVAGLDALILFIALVLVAAVVGAALINTSSTLIVRDKRTATEKEKDIQKPIIVESVRGFDSNDDDRLDQLIFALRLRGGDDAITFNDTVIMANTKALNCTSVSYGPNAQQDCSFTVSYSKRGLNYQPDYLSVGDYVEVTVAGPNIMPGVEDTGARFTFIPSHGAATEVKATVPERIHPKNLVIWPLND